MAENTGENISPIDRTRNIIRKLFRQGTSKEANFKNVEVWSLKALDDMKFEERQKLFQRLVGKDIRLLNDFPSPLLCEANSWIETFRRLDEPSQDDWLKSEIQTVRVISLPTSYISILVKPDQLEYLASLSGGKMIGQTGDVVLPADSELIVKVVKFTSGPYASFPKIPKGAFHEYALMFKSLKMEPPDQKPLAEGKLSPSR